MNRWGKNTKRVVLVLLVLFALYVLYNAGEVIRPFLWAGILAYVLMPLVNELERRGARRTVAAGLVFLGLVAVLVVVGRLVVPLLVEELASLRRDAPTIAGNAERALAAALQQIGVPGIEEVLRGQLGGDLGTSIARMAIPFAITALRFLLEFLLFLIALFFLLRDGPRFLQWIIRQIPKNQRSELVPLLSDVNALLGHYVRGQFTLVLIMSVVTTVGLTLLRVPYSILLGVLTGFLETIPIAGPITAGAIASVVALGHENAFGWQQMWYVAAVVVMYTVLRHAEDYFVVPLVIGRIVKLHPLVVIFSLLTGGAVFGLLGILLAVPFAATLRLVLIYVAAKLRDEDPLPQLEAEAAQEEHRAAEKREELRSPAG